MESSIKYVTDNYRGKNHEKIIMEEIWFEKGKGILVRISIGHDGNYFGGV